MKQVRVRQILASTVAGLAAVSVSVLVSVLVSVSVRPAYAQHAATFPAQFVERLDFSAVPESPASRAGLFRVVLINGDVLIRTSVVITRDKLLGEGVDTVRQIDLKQVVSIESLDGAAHSTDVATRSLNSVDAGGDLIRLRNGDVLRGLIAGSDGQNLELIDASNQTQSVLLAGVSELVFAQTQQHQAAMPEAVLLFSDGTVMSANALSSSPTVDFLWSVDGSKRQADAKRLVAAYVLNGSRVPLSMLAPVAIESGDFVSRPAASDDSAGTSKSSGLKIFRMDISAGSLDQKPVHNAIVMRPLSRVTYAVPTGMRRFHAYLDLGSNWTASARPGTVDADASRASRLGTAIARVKSGDKVLFESGKISANEPIRIDVDLAGATQITLELDFGENYGIASRGVWIEPWFVE